MNSILFYKIMAKCYDLLDIIYFHDKKNSPRKAVLDAVNRNDTILDLCTGTASMAIQIAKRYPNTKIMGIDISKDMLRVAQNKIHKEQITNVELLSMDATDMSFEKERFDKILVSLILHEMDEGFAEKMIKEARRVMREDGRIIVTEWEQSKTLKRKFLFMPIHILEPKTYREFIKKDLHQYFGKFDLEVEKEIHCNYSKVLILKKR